MIRYHDPHDMVFARLGMHTHPGYRPRRCVWAYVCRFPSLAARHEAYDKALAYCRAHGEVSAWASEHPDHPDHRLPQFNWSFGFTPDDS